MSRNYINNRDLYNALVEHRKIYDKCISEGVEPPELPRYICESFMAIGKGLAKKPRFSSYTWKEDMISLGVLDCVKYWKTFNPEKTENPFAFFTAVFMAAFFRYNNKEEKEKYVKFKTCITKGINNTFDVVDGETFDDDTPVHADMPYENIGNFVDEYEKRLDEQKNKQKESVKKKPKKKKRLH